MSRELVVVWAGRHRRDDWDRLCAPYKRRIERHVRLCEVPVRVRTRADGAARLRLEGEAVLAAVPADSWTVALDRRGEMKSSEEIADWLSRLLAEWPHPVTFLLGSDLGLADPVRIGARQRLSFGPLTLPHELARLVLFEQLYRALSIAAGIKYHRQPL